MVGLPRQSRIAMSNTRPAPAGDVSASHCWNGGGSTDGMEASAQGAPGTTATVTGDPGNDTPPTLTDTCEAVPCVL